MDDVPIKAEVVHIDGPISQLLGDKLQQDIQLLPTTVGRVQLAPQERMLKPLLLAVLVGEKVLPLYVRVLLVLSSHK